MRLIGIDFDGTCVTHAYPDVGDDIGAVPILRELVENGNQLILWTMRSNEFLQDAVDWFAGNNLPLFGINENPQQKEWTQSPKAYCHLYIDDAALGIPLIYCDTGGRPFVDWPIVRQKLVELGYIKGCQHTAVERRVYSDDGNWGQHKRNFCLVCNTWLD